MSVLDNVKVDREHMCIDRKSEAGQMFEALSQHAASKAGTPEGEFMAQMVAFTEAAAIINATMSGKEAQEALDELRTAMAASMPGEQG